MKRLMLAVVVSAFAIGTSIGPAAAQGTPGTCESKAVGSDGKPLKGAAKNSFMAKCLREQASLHCAGNAAPSFRCDCRRDHPGDRACRRFLVPAKYSPSRPY